MVGELVGYKIYLNKKALNYNNLGHLYGGVCSLWLSSLSQKFPEKQEFTGILVLFAYLSRARTNVISISSKTYLSG